MAHVGNFTFNVVRESRGSEKNANAILLLMLKGSQE